MFESLWKFISERSKVFPVVQEYKELEHVFNLMKGCGSYLEIGTAEGNSLYVLSHALLKGYITSVDLGEAHTTTPRNEIFALIKGKHEVAMYLGDSTDPNTYPNKREHDVVLIDGGHDYETVKSDANMYGHLAKKFLLFHDVTMPEVKRAVDEYVKEKNLNYREFINSDDKGYGIVEL